VDEIGKDSGTAGNNKIADERFQHKRGDFSMASLHLSSRLVRGFQVMLFDQSRSDSAMLGQINPSK